MFVLVLVFRRPIADLIERIRKVRGPSGWGLDAEQPPPPEGGPEPVRQFVQDAQKEAALQNLVAARKCEVLAKQVLDRTQAALSWEFMYLFMFLVPKTKAVLRRLAASTPPRTRSWLNAQWPSWGFGDDQEREAVYSALVSSDLVDRGDILTVTPKGRAFLAFMDTYGAPRA